MDLFYTYIEYKRDHILESIYEKHSKYINDYGKMLTSIRKTNVPYKKLDMIPYFITKLFNQLCRFNSFFKLYTRGNIYSFRPRTFYS